MLPLEETVVQSVVAGEVEPARINLELVDLGVLVRLSGVVLGAIGTPELLGGLTGLLRLNTLQLGGVVADVSREGELSGIFGSSLALDCLLITILVVENDKFVDESFNCNFFLVGEVLLNVFFTGKKELLEEFPDLDVGTGRRRGGLRLRLHLHRDCLIQEL